MSLTLKNTSPCLIDRPLTINNDTVKVDEYGGSIGDGIGNGVGVFTVYLHAGKVACVGCSIKQ